MNPASPTAYPEVNAMLQELLERAQAILKDHFIGMYLDGSLASGDFDQDSDIDFVIVTDEDVTEVYFSALQAMHARLATLESAYAVQLEGSYISRHALRRYDPLHALHPNIERGAGEQLKMAHHGDAWVIHRSILRACGITVLGPAPQTLIDPISPADLRQAMLPILSSWATHIRQTPTQIKQRGYQSYIVLSLCRMLYTLQHGAVVSKPVAARWAQATFGEQWAALIERAWDGRHNPGSAASSEDVNRTVAFIDFAQNYSRQFALDAGAG